MAWPEFHRRDADTLRSAQTLGDDDAEKRFRTRRSGPEDSSTRGDCRRRVSLDAARTSAQCRLVFPIGRPALMVGGPPGVRSRRPLDSLLAEALIYVRAKQVRRGRRAAGHGGPPHHLCRCPALGKLCGIGLKPAPPTEGFRREDTKGGVTRRKKLRTRRQRSQDSASLGDSGRRVRLDAGTHECVRHEFSPCLPRGVAVF